MAVRPRESLFATKREPKPAAAGAVRKWLAGIASSVIAALLIWWLTSSGGLLNPKPDEQEEFSLPVTVRLEASSGLFQRGFFSPRGLIVTMTTETMDGEVSAIWHENGGQREARARVIGTGALQPDVMLLELIDEDPPEVDFGIRRAASLEPGEIIESFLGPTQRSPGRVVEVYGTREILDVQGPRRLHNVLVTTRMAGVGDSGIPLLDSDDRVVGMIFASNSDSIAIPIEFIEGDFPDAF